MIRKILSSLFLLALTCSAAGAQERSYALTRGKVSSTVHWSEKDLGSGSGERSIRISPFPGKVYDQKVDSLHRTFYWRYEESKENTDVVIDLKEGVYHIGGTFKGKKIDKSVRSEGYPWYQNISYFAGLTLKNKGEKVVYECFRPDNLDFNTMVAENVGNDIIEGYQVNDIKVCATGAKGKLWSCHSYTDTQSGILVCYKAVEGLPGTPLTTWMLNK